MREFEDAGLVAAAELQRSADDAFCHFPEVVLHDGGSRLSPECLR